MRVNAAVLDFAIVLIDNFGLQFREKLMDRLFKLATVFLPRLSVDSTERHEQVGIGRHRDSETEMQRDSDIERHTFFRCSSIN